VAENGKSEMGILLYLKQFTQPGWVVSLSLCFLGCMIYLYVFMYVLFYFGQLCHFPSCFGTGVTNLNEPPLSFLLPPHCEQQAMRDEGVKLCRWLPITE